MTKDEALAMDLALEILKAAYVPADLDEQREKAITAIEQARSAPVQDSTCNNSLREQGKAYPRTCKKCGLGPCIALANLALDKKAENALELGLNYKPVAWNTGVPPLYPEMKDGETISVEYTTLPAQPAPTVQEPVAGQPLPCPFCGHIGLDFGDGETYRWGIASCGGCGASCMDVRREYPDQGQWHTEAIAEWNKRSPAAQRQWVGLTDAEIRKWWSIENGLEDCKLSKLDDFTLAVRAIEAKLRSATYEKNDRHG